MPSVQKLYVFTNVIKETQFFQDYGVLAQMFELMDNLNTFVISLHSIYVFQSIILYPHHIYN